MSFFIIWVRDRFGWMPGESLSGDVRCFHPHDTLTYVGRLVNLSISLFFVHILVGCKHLWPSKDTMDPDGIISTLMDNSLDGDGSYKPNRSTIDVEPSSGLWGL